MQLIRLSVLTAVNFRSYSSGMDRIFGIGNAAFTIFTLTHCRLNELPHTIYWKILILILGMSDYVI